MRRSRRVRVADLPRLLISGADQLAGLFAGRYARSEGANLLATDETDRILVVRTTYLGPGWMLPGGRVERGETPQAAAVRETQEETGLEVVVDRLVLVDAHRPSNVSFVFAGHVVGGTLEPQLGEIAAAGWVPRDEIADASHQLRRLLELIDAAGGGVAYLGLPAR